MTDENSVIEKGLVLGRDVNLPDKNGRRLEIWLQRITIISN